jgi:hypothetical protein
MACDTLSSLDVGSSSTSVIDDASGTEFFENVNAVAFFYSFVFRSPDYLADANAIVAACSGLIKLTADDSPAGLATRKWIADDLLESDIHKWAAAAATAHPKGPAADAVKQLTVHFAEL